MELAQKRFSFVIPTRDRAAFVSRSVKSILDQKFSNFEVIVYDNPSSPDLACAGVVEGFDDQRVKYYRAPVPLDLCENWEAAIKHATGEYVSIFFDKFIFKPNGLSDIDEAINNFNSPDLISWPRETFYPEHDISCEGGISGVFEPTLFPGRPRRYSPQRELKRRLTFVTPRGGPGDLFHRGKIVFGFYKKVLLDKIVEKSGSVFPPYYPDYTSLSQALSIANTGVDMMTPYIIGIQPKHSTGLILDKEAGGVRSYLSRFGDADTLSAGLPFEGVASSQHNVVARDYLFGIISVGKMNDYWVRSINKNNLLNCIYRDLILSPKRTRDIEKEIKEIKNYAIKNNVAMGVFENRKMSVLDAVLSFIVFTILNADSVRFLKFTRHFIDYEKLRGKFIYWPKEIRGGEGGRAPNYYSSVDEAMKFMCKYYSGGWFRAKVKYLYWKGVR